MSQEFVRLWMTQIWQIAAVAVVVALVVRVAARKRPHLAHAMWVLVLIKCVTPPLWGHSLGVFSQIQAYLVSDEDSRHARSRDSELSPSNPRPATGVISATQGSSPLPSQIARPSVEGSTKSGEARTTGESSTTDLSLSDFPGIEQSKGGWRQSEAEPPANATNQRSGSQELDGVVSYLPQLILATVLIGSVITLLIMIIRCLRCLRVIHRYRTTEFDEPLRERIQQLATQLRVRQVPRIVVSDVLLGPAVLGVLRHTIVLPRCLLQISDVGRSFLPERTSAEGGPARCATDKAGRFGSAACTQVAAGREVLPGRQDLLFLDPILAHELLHIRRGDLQTGMLQMIVQSLWWFHPAVWLSNRWLSREAERCCDEQVIAELGCSPAQYARSLLSVIECKHRLQPVPVFPGMKPVEITSQRMERIMSLKNGLRKRTPLWCWLAIIALAIVVLPGAAATTLEDKAEPAPTPAAQLRKKVSLSFDNAALTEVLRSLATQHGINIAVNAQDAEMRGWISDNPPAAVTFHCQDEPLEDALTAILKPLGLCMHLNNETVVIFRADGEPENTVQTVRIYSVADLVVPIRRVVPEAAHHTDSVVETSPEPAAAVAPRPARIRTVDGQFSASDVNVRDQNIKADFAPLMELIKATVEPDSWRKDGPQVVENPDTLSLVIRQADKAHQGIDALLSQLRNAQDQSIQISCRQMKLTKDAQRHWLIENYSFHPLTEGTQWALVAQQRNEALLNALKEHQFKLISCPRVMTIGGQTAVIEVSGDVTDAQEPADFRLEMTPHLLPQCDIIRLQHLELFGDDATRQVHESLVGSGQTLLLLIESPLPPGGTDASPSHYLLMMTPEHIKLSEEQFRQTVPAAAQ